MQKLLKDKTMKKKCVLLVIVMTVLMVACGSKSSDVSMISSQTNNPKTNEENLIMLSPRQIEILKSQNLPTEYDRLTITQQSAIVSIETMLNHLETKYGKEFKYAGYWSGINGQKEHLDAECDIGTVTVSRIYNGSEVDYQDNYSLVEKYPIYYEKFSDELDEIFGAEHYKFFPEFNKNFIGEITAEDDLSEMSADLAIFVDKKSDSKLSFSAETLAQWISSTVSEGVTNVIIYVVEDEKLNEIEEYNYVDIIHWEDFPNKLLFKVRPDGEIIFF